MAVLKYSDIPVILTHPNGPTPYRYYYAPASNLTITTQNQLEPSRILAANQNNNFRIGGELNTKISMTFAAIASGDTGNFWTYNLASGVLKDLTGNIASDIYIADLQELYPDEKFSDCYLENVSVEITPFAPIMLTAEFTCLNPPIGKDLGASPAFDNNIASGIAYGYTTTINGGTSLSDPNRESIVYKINCNRSYTTTLGNETPTNVFLNSVEKEVSIKAPNINSFISHSGYGEAININPKTLDGQDILTDGFGLSSNCRIVAQNLSVQEGDVLAGDISLKEVIL